MQPFYYRVMITDGSHALGVFTDLKTFEGATRRLERRFRDLWTMIDVQRTPFPGQEV